MSTPCTSTHSCLCFLLIFAQCFGMLPVRGITHNNSSQLKFSWASKRTLYSIIFAVSAAVNTVFFLIQMINQQNIELQDYVTLSFFVVTVITVMIFLDIAREWPRLMKKWADVDKLMTTYGFPSGLHFKMKMITLVIMGAAVQHSLFIVVQLMSFGDDVDFPETVDRYFQNRFQHAFAIVSYHIAWGIFFQILNIYSTLSWSFMDLFVIVVSLCLAARFKQVVQHIRFLASKNIKNENIWEKVREEYTHLAVFCETLDGVMSSIILVSFGNNLFVILIQLYHTLRSPSFGGALDKIYYIYSFCFLIIRTSAVAMYAATINIESKKPRRYLNSLPCLVYNIEIERLLHQSKYNSPSLSGHRIFRVTKTLVLRIALAIVSYELVLKELLRSREE